MAWRILKGQRLNGTFGFDVSKPGFDVTTANIMQMAFTSDYRIPKVVVKGTVVAGPTSGFAPRPNTYPGAAETVTTVGFGRTVSAPAIFAIASSPAWNVPLATAATGILGGLANQWHTYIAELMPYTGVVFDGTYGVNIRKVNDPGNYQNGEVPTSWAACKFYMYGYSDRIEFRSNNVNAITIKYLVLEQP